MESMSINPIPTIAISVGKETPESSNASGVAVGVIVATAVGVGVVKV